MAGRVPVTILTGFLGAGKTTLLRRLLADPQGTRFGVLVNDFGAVNVDAELVVEASAGRVTLENGCVCCTMQGDLVGALADLLEADPRPDRIVIEASGVSRPLPIAAVLETDGLAARATLDGIFCLLDTAAFGDLDFEATELALEQVAGSDLAILTKTDIAPADRVAAVEATLGGALPRLRLIRASHGEVPRALLFGPEAGRAGELRLAERSHDHSDHAHDHHAHAGHDHVDHAEEFAAWHWTSPAALDARRLRAALRQLPTGLLRAKGVIRPMGGEGRIVVQLVGKRLEVAHEDAPTARSAFVAIGRRGGFDPAELDALMEACAAESAADDAVSRESSGASPAPPRPSAW